MTQYIYTLPILFMTIFCMLFLTVTNKYILSIHKKGFFVVFLGSFFTTIFEVLSLFLNGAAAKFKFALFISNYFGFLLTPILIIFFAASIGRFHRLKVAIIGMSVYFILCNALVATKQLFFIDAQNTYHRGNLFFIYIISYFLAVLYLLYETLRYSRKGFLRHKVFAYILSFCFLVSSSIQVFNPEVYTTRIAVVLSLCTYYAYNVEFTNLFDKLTGALNQGTYLKKIEELKPQQSVIILDIDNFKYINDHYGHPYGNQCLASISRVIKSTFGNYGQCYRIGGDEFAVILRRHNNVENLISRFEKAIAEKFKNSSCQLSLSLGYSKCEKDDSFDAVVRRADSNMYDVKNHKKALSAQKSNP